MQPLLKLRILLPLLACSGTPSGADRHISFSSDIKPIFEATCWRCHSADAQLSKLDLGSRESAIRGGERGAAVVPGDASKSRIYRMVAGLEKPIMPAGGKLKPEEVEAIRLWIDQGATWDVAGAARPLVSAAPSETPIPPEGRDYWAYRKPVRAIPPGAGNPIDSFVRSALAAKSIPFAPRTNGAALVRRASLDLIGLPPTPAETAEYLNDRSPNAWEHLIDRLLASPHYGERWGRHWLDVARYADSNGFEHDFDRPNAWRYRDYVIASFNKDKPYDQFLREQIAGDELEPVTPESLIATGFLRNYAKVGYREKDNPENRYDYLDDMIATLGRGVLGLTVQCARCHDHKFDPIQQADYYRLQASLFGYVEVDFPLTSREEADAYEKKMASVDGRVSELRARVRALEEPYRALLLPAKYKEFPQNVQDAIATPEAQRTPGQVLLASQVIRGVSLSQTQIDRAMKPMDLAEKRRLNAEITEVEKLRPKPIPMAAGITDGDYRFTPDGPGDEPAPGKGVKREAIDGSFLHRGPGRYEAPPSHFLIRGEVGSKGPQTQPGFVKVITYGNPPVALPPASGQTSGRRRALAEWIVSRDNPLTARVMVNRIWHHHFGRGLVPTLDNFGKMGDSPSHPELLDWLAVEFMEGGWSIKKMHRLILTSDTYKMASQFTDAGAAATDPENRTLWRYGTHRLDAEIIRDSILAVSGALNPEMGGRPIFPRIQPDVLASMSLGIWRQPKEEGPESWRRSVYVYRKRGLPLPMLEIFDLPNQNLSCGARNVTTVPTQALALMNDDFVIHQAKLFAGRLEEAAPKDSAKQIDLAYRLALNRLPDSGERELALEFLARSNLADFAHVMFNLNEFLYSR